MCGICGYLNIDKRPIQDSAVLKDMMCAIRHRGPDDEGFHIKDNVALGHRRLSIIDLAHGHQPISDENKSLTIVYNGEVYNFFELRTELINRGHSFTTQSDTEVVLKAYKEWGPACLDKFNGMFALAIWDDRNKSLFLARDRFGKKPLYYATFGKTFIFASELKSLYKHPEVKMDVDRLALGKYLAHDYIPSPSTIIKGICKLEPGHYLLLKDGDLTKRRYWDFHFNVDPHRKSNFELTKNIFLELLRESVRKRLISDVPLGVFLSGGIDSSAVVAMMSTLMDPSDIKTFSIGFKEKSYDEADSASLVARHFKTDHHVKIVDGDMMMEVLPKILDIIDEPFADSSIIPTYLVSAFTREHVTVALGGDGGDELFMGYPSFVAHRLASFYDVLPRPLKKLAEISPKILPGGSNYLSLQFKAMRFLRGVNCPGPIRHQTWIGSFPPDEQRLLFRDSQDQALFDPRNIYSESIAHFDNFKDISDLDKVEYLYIKTYLPDDILTKVDRASMATSLEVRAPFLDKEMGDFAGTVPNELKLKGLRTKHIMKEALKGLLPDEIINKKKHGFAVPVGSWFKTGLKDSLLETFEKSTVEKDGLFNYQFIDGLLKDHFSGKMDNGRKIWALFIAQMWYNKWIKK
jgi:asparagine synthase (glutamine-hydrolysing)